MAATPITDCMYNNSQNLYCFPTTMRPTQIPDGCQYGPGGSCDKATGLIERSLDTARTKADKISSCPAKITQKCEPCKWTTSCNRAKKYFEEQVAGQDGKCWNQSGETFRKLKDQPCDVYRCNDNLAFYIGTNYPGVGNPVNDSKTGKQKACSLQCNNKTSKREVYDTNANKVLGVTGESCSR